jgi:Protein of unknown function (DUF4089)
MAKTRKSRPKAKAARATSKSKMRARKTPPATRKPAKPTKPKAGKAPVADPLDGFIAAAARMLALPLEPQWLASIKTNLEVNLRAATFVAAFALPDEAEPAPVFTA